MVISAEAASTEVTGPPITASFDFTSIGDPVPIPAPGPDELDPSPRVQEEDIAAVDFLTPVGLASLPSGWDLEAATVNALLATCPVISTVYSGSADAALEIQARTPQCASDTAQGEPFAAGPHVGVIDNDPGFDEAFPGIVSFRFEIDGMAVDVTTADVPDPATLLVNLGPDNPADQALAPTSVRFRR